jgi:squalene-hopene/tetraprenyl-beta-curcumene cyclase
VTPDLADLDVTLANARARLLAARNAAGHWEGELSSSALSTATAVFALHQYWTSAPASAGSREVDRACERLVRAGLAWLALHQNPDGGWGDTVHSLSNISTTALCWAALSIDAGKAAPACASSAAAAESWLARAAGGLGPPTLARAIADRYGADRTFSVPILTMCALAGRLGSGRDAWRLVPQLPFELAAFPQRWFKWLRLPVVSYALPALIAIGQARHAHRPTRNPVARAARAAARQRTLRLLERIQPSTGGFLEATPLTSFVLMSLAGAGAADHPVAARGAEFLVRSAREDGSWPIDTNLATWVTTLSVNALAAGGLADAMNPQERATVRGWLLGQQYRTEHPYTLAEPGGWAWTDLPGGVPDADDTPGALLAIRELPQHDAAAPASSDGGGQDASLRRMARAEPDARSVESAAAGIEWLLKLQNANGGIPTFCRGWGKLPFDRSSADLTAHALRALRAWEPYLSPPLQARVGAARRAAIGYLIRAQRPDGAWVPLWFGDQHAPGDENPTYGTSRVLRAAFSLSLHEGWAMQWTPALQRGVRWLLSSQNADGGWGGAPGSASSIEETALAVEALAEIVDHDRQSRAAIDVREDDHWTVARKMDEVLLDEADLAEGVAAAVERGAAWLVGRTARGTSFPPTPIGFYFAKLWYFETLYPLAFATSALGHARRALGGHPTAATKGTAAAEVSRT